MEEKQNNTLSDKAREAQRKYLRDWRKKNPDKMRKYRDNYWEKKAKNANDREPASTG